MFRSDKQDLWQGGLDSRGNRTYIVLMTNTTPTPEPTIADKVWASVFIQATSEGLSTRQASCRADEAKRSYVATSTLKPFTPTFGEDA